VFLERSLESRASMGRGWLRLLTARRQMVLLANISAHDAELLRSLPRSAD
jgi:hypothetical protein